MTKTEKTLQKLIENDSYFYSITEYFVFKGMVKKDFIVNSPKFIEFLEYFNTDEDNIENLTHYLQIRSTNCYYYLEYSYSYENEYCYTCGEYNCRLDNIKYYRFSKVDKNAKAWKPPAPKKRTKADLEYLEHLRQKGKTNLEYLEHLEHLKQKGIN